MPLATSSLIKKSSDDEVRNAISQCIRQARREGRKSDQAVAMCLDDARKHAGNRSFLRKG